MPLVAGVDSSTTATKVEVRDLDSGKVVGRGSSPHPPTHPPRSEQDPDAWWAAFGTAWAEAGSPEVAAISVAVSTRLPMLPNLVICGSIYVLGHLAARTRRIRLGVGIAVLQLCRTVDGLVTFGTASASKHDVLREEGCTHPIDYRTQDFEAEVMRLTDGEGVDVVIDAIGQHPTDASATVLRALGAISVFSPGLITGIPHPGSA